MYKPFEVIDLYKHVQPSGKLFPESTNLDFWDSLYSENSAVIDREFARRFSHFKYSDFMEGETKEASLLDFQADVLSVLTVNQKKYAEMYRVFLVSDNDDPITYNYDMTETTGAQKQTNTYGATSATKGTEQFTKGSETFDKGSETITKGQQINTEGELTNTHNVTGFNSNTLVPESSDTKGSQTITEGQRIDTEGQRQDTYGQRIDTYGSRTDTTLEHVDTVDNDEWTLTRKGNIGVQTAGDILRIHTEFWTEHYKFMSLIFEDICKALLLVGDC